MFAFAMGNDGIWKNSGVIGHFMSELRAFINSLSFELSSLKYFEYNWGALTLNSPVYFLLTIKAAGNKRHAFKTEKYFPNIHKSSSIINFHIYWFVFHFSTLFSSSFALSKTHEKLEKQEKNIKVFFLSLLKQQ